MDPMLQATLPPRDSTLQCKRCYTTEITFLALQPWFYTYKIRDRCLALYESDSFLNRCITICIYPIYIYRYRYRIAIDK